MLIDNFLNIVKNHYADFTGRARRQEYWYFVLAQILLSIALAVLSGVLGFVSETIGGAVYGLGSLVLGLGLLVPSIAVAARRLHDTGKSGWWLLIYFTGIGIIVLLVFFCLEGETGPNQYGPDPKQAGAVAGGADNLSRHLVD